MSNSAKKHLDMLIERFTGWVKKVHAPVKQKELLSFTSSCRGKFEDEWGHFHHHS